MTLALVALLALFVSLPQAWAAETVIAGGRAGGLYRPVAGAICTLVNEKTREHGVSCAVDLGLGSLTNLATLRERSVTMAIAQADTQEQAFEGTGPFEAAGPFPDMRAVATLFVEHVVLVARRDKAIQSVADLKGRRVNLSPPGSGGRQLIETLLAGVGLSTDDIVEVTDYAAPDLAEALCDGEIDAFSLTVGHPSSLIRETAAACDVVLVPVNDAEAATLTDANPLYIRSSIPGGTYRGSPNDVPGVGLMATLVTRADVDEAVVHAITEAIFENLERLRQSSPLFDTLDPSEMARKGFTAPLHEGALRYYGEAGLR